MVVRGSTSALDLDGKKKVPRKELFIFYRQAGLAWARLGGAAHRLPYCFHGPP